MYWTLELASKLEDAPWPATKTSLLITQRDRAHRQRLSKTLMKLKTKARFMNGLRISGPIILLRRISFLMKMNINP